MRNSVIKLILFCFIVFLGLPTSGAPKVRTVRLVTACGFGPNVRLTYQCSLSAPPSVSDIISKMIAFNGNSSKGIQIEDSPGMDYPVTGRDVDNNVIIIVDAEKMLKLPSWNLRAILAHELGHITNGHVYMKSCISHEYELSADYYAGFWSSRAGCSSVDSVLAPFSNVKPDDHHPKHADRIKSVRTGWDEEKKPFEIKAPVKTIGFPKLKDLYGQYLKLFATVTPYRWQLGKKVRYTYKTKVMLSTKNIRVPLEQLLSVVARVEYASKDGFFKFPLLLNANRDNDFCYMYIGGENPLPVVCTIYFVDKSSLVIKEKFVL